MDVRTAGQSLPVVLNELTPRRQELAPREPQVVEIDLAALPALLEPSTFAYLPPPPLIGPSLGLPRAPLSEFSPRTLLRDMAIVAQAARIDPMLGALTWYFISLAHAMYAVQQLMLLMAAIHQSMARQNLQQQLASASRLEPRPSFKKKQTVQQRRIDEPTTLRNKVRDQKSAQLETKIAAERVAAPLIQINDAKDVDALIATNDLAARVLEAPALQINRAENVGVAKMRNTANVDHIRAPLNLENEAVDVGRLAAANIVRAKSVEAPVVLRNEAVRVERARLANDMRVAGDLTAEVALENVAEQALEADMTNHLEVGGVVDAEVRLENRAADVTVARQTNRADLNHVRAPVNLTNIAERGVEVHAVNIVRAERVEAELELDNRAEDVQHAQLTNRLQARRIERSVHLSNRAIHVPVVEAENVLEAERVDADVTLSNGVLDAVEADLSNRTRIGRTTAPVALRNSAASVDLLHASNLLEADEINAPVSVGSFVSRARRAEVDDRIDIGIANAPVIARASVGRVDELVIAQHVEIEELNERLEQSVEATEVLESADVSLSARVQRGTGSIAQRAELAGPGDVDVRLDVEANRATGPIRQVADLERVTGESNAELTASGDAARIEQIAISRRATMHVVSTAENAEIVVEKRGDGVSDIVVEAQDGADIDVSGGRFGASRVRVEGGETANIRPIVAGVQDVTVRGVENARISAPIVGATRDRVEGGNIEFGRSVVGTADRRYQGTARAERVIDNAPVFGSSRHRIDAAGGADRVEVHGGLGTQRVDVRVGRGDTFKIDGGGMIGWRGEDFARIDLDGHEAHLVDPQGRTVFKTPSWKSGDARVEMDDFERIEVTDGGRSVWRGTGADRNGAPRKNWSSRDPAKSAAWFEKNLLRGSVSANDARRVVQNLGHYDDESLPKVLDALGPDQLRRVDASLSDETKWTERDALRRIRSARNRPGTLPVDRPARERRFQADVKKLRGWTRSGRSADAARALDTIRRYDDKWLPYLIDGVSRQGLDRLASTTSAVDRRTYAPTIARIREGRNSKREGLDSAFTVAKKVEKLIDYEGVTNVVTNDEARSAIHELSRYGADEQVEIMRYMRRDFLRNFLNEEIPSDYAATYGPTIRQLQRRMPR